MPNYYFSFDVESIGLYGEGFAVGVVVVDAWGTETEFAYFACPESEAKGRKSDRQWIQENVVPHLPDPNCANPAEVRTRFWSILHRWMAEKALILTDCGVPVESNFLRQCVADDPDSRTWHAPYPLIGIETMLLAAGLDPIGTYDRLPSELPTHNPVNDARQSVRMFLKAAKIVGIQMIK